MTYASDIKTYINDLIDQEIEVLREENGETSETPEEDCYGAREVFLMAKQNVKERLEKELDSF